MYVRIPEQLIIRAYGHKHGRQGDIAVHHHVTLRIVVIRLVLPMVKLPAVRWLCNQVSSLARTVHAAAGNLATVCGAYISGQSVVLVINKYRLQLVITVHNQVTRVHSITVTPPQERVVLGRISKKANNATLIVLINAQM